MKALDKAFDSLQWLKTGCKVLGTTYAAPASNAVTASFTLATSADHGGAYGCLEGKSDYDIYDPETGNRITDIDLFEKGVMWEYKTTTYAEGTAYFDKIDKKIAAYVKSRKIISDKCGCYANAPIGYRFSKPGADPRFIAPSRRNSQNCGKSTPTQTSDWSLQSEL